MLVAGALENVNRRTAGFVDAPTARDAPPTTAASCHVAPIPGSPLSAFIASSPPKSDSIRLTTNVNGAARAVCEWLVATTCIDTVFASMSRVGRVVCVSTKSPTSKPSAGAVTLIGVAASCASPRGQVERVGNEPTACPFHLGIERIAPVSADVDWQTEWIVRRSVPIDELRQYAVVGGACVAKPKRREETLPQFLIIGVTDDALDHHAEQDVVRIRVSIDLPRRAERHLVQVIPPAMAKVRQLRPTRKASERTS